MRTEPNKRSSSVIESIHNDYSHAHTSTRFLTYKAINIKKAQIVSSPFSFLFSFPVQSVAVHKVTVEQDEDNKQEKKSFFFSSFDCLARAYIMFMLPFFSPRHTEMKGMNLEWETEKETITKNHDFHPQMLTVLFFCFLASSRFSRCHVDDSWGILLISRYFFVFSIEIEEI